MAAALVALAVTQEARRVGVVLDLVEVSPPTFDPGGRSGRTLISFRSRRPVGEGVVRIVELDGDPVRTLANGLPLEGGDRIHRFHWDGSTDAGGLAGPGLYRIEILIPDEDREIVPGDTVTVEDRGRAGNGR